MQVKIDSSEPLSVLTNPESFSAERARAVNLVILPKNILGKNCRNCEYFYGEQNGYCSNEKVLMNVNYDWACSEWHNPVVVPVTSPDQFNEPFKNRIPRREPARMSLSGEALRIHESISRFNKVDIDELLYEIDESNEDDRIKKIAREAVIRFSKCGHTSDGEFDHGNTCGKLRGKNTSKATVEHHESKASHHESRAVHHRKRAERLKKHLESMEGKKGKDYDSERTYQLMQKSKNKAIHHENESENEKYR